MKSIKYLLVLMITLFSLTTFAQSYESDGMDPEMEDQMIASEDDSEFVPPVSDEFSAPGEIERQEDILYPEGEDTSWSLGSEDLAAEEYE